MMYCLVGSLGVLGYIGPGAGLGLLGSLVGVLVAVAGAVLMAVAWPLRVLLRKLSARKTTPQE